jgi:hypothetical protein
VEWVGRAEPLALDEPPEAESFFVASADEDELEDDGGVGVLGFTLTEPDFDGADRMIFAKPKIKGKEIEIATAFYRKKPPTPDPGVSPMLAKLVTNDKADILAREDRDQPIDAEREAPMGWSAVAERVEEEPELAVGVGVGDAKEVEHPALQVAVVDPDRPRTELPAVEHQVVGERADEHGVDEFQVAVDSVRGEQCSRDRGRHRREPAAGARRAWDQCGHDGPPSRLTSLQ